MQHVFSKILGRFPSSFVLALVLVLEFPFFH